MRDMACFRATITIAPCYIIRSSVQGGRDAETGDKAQRPWFPHGAPDHGAARPVGATLELADPVGAAGADADLARVARGLRRGFPDRAAGAAIGTARGGLCRAGAGRRLRPP